MSPKYKGFLMFIILILFGLGFSACNIDGVSVGKTEEFFKIYDINSDLSFDAFDFHEADDGRFLIYGRIFDGSDNFERVSYFLLTDNEGNVFGDSITKQFFARFEEIMPYQIVPFRLVKSGSSFYFLDPSGAIQDPNGPLPQPAAYIVKVDVTENREAPFVFSDFFAIPSPIGSASLGEVAFELLADQDQGDFYLSGAMSDDGLYYVSKVNSGGIVWRDSTSRVYQWDANRNTPAYNDVYGELSFATLNGDKVLFKKHITEDASSFSPAFNFQNFRTTDGMPVFDSITPHQSIIQTQATTSDTEFPHVVYNVGNQLFAASVETDLSGNEILRPKIRYAISNQSGMSIAVPDSLNPFEYSSHEYDRQFPITIYKVTKGAIDALIYLGTTKSGQIALISFDQDTGALLNRRVIGADSFYIGKRFLQTSDGGFAVLGEVFTAGRFKQICLFKFASFELDALLK